MHIHCIIIIAVSAWPRQWTAAVLHGGRIWWPPSCCPQEDIDLWNTDHMTLPTAAYLGIHITHKFTWQPPTPTQHLSSDRLLSSTSSHTTHTVHYTTHTVHYSQTHCPLRHKPQHTLSTTPQTTSLFSLALWEWYTIKGQPWCRDKPLFFH